MMIFHAVILTACWFNITGFAIRTGTDWNLLEVATTRDSEFLFLVYVIKQI